MSDAPKRAPANLFDQFEVEALTLYNSPTDDGGGALVFKFAKHVEIEGDALAFPLNEEQMIRLFRLLMGYMGERGLIELNEMNRLVKLPSEVLPTPRHKLPTPSHN